jgi:S1-C subfamily serine protease
LTRPKGRVHIDEIIEYFSRILREEQSVDRLVGGKDRHFPAVVYLRALQGGECSFPYVLRDTPTAQAMMNQLALAYPEIKKRSVSEPFASIYDATVAYGRKQIKQNGSVSIYRLIEEMRRAIVQSAGTNVSPERPEPPSITPSVPKGKLLQTRSSGSGFFVTQAGHLLTNAHVVDDCTTISVKSSDGQTGVAQIIAADQNGDLALLRLARRIEMTAAFRFQDRASHARRRVVVSKLNAVRGDVPQNVNFAIKASTAANFLDAHGIAYRSATGEKPLPIPDIVEQAKGFSAQVLCQG